MNLRDIGFGQTLPKELAHKRAVHEVLLTGYRADSPHQTTLGAVAPRSHGLYCESPMDTTLDIAVLAEMCRQACFVVAHAQFDVPAEGNTVQFLLRDLSVAITPAGWSSTSTDREIAIHSTADNVRRRGTTVSGLTWTFRLDQGPIHLADARVSMTWVDRARWRETRTTMRHDRGLALTPILTPPGSVLNQAEVGRVNPQNVVLTAITEDRGALSATLAADIRHPTLFDHPIDHIYGMVQMEACRQLAVAAAARRTGRPARELRASAFTAEFASITEFDLPTTLRVVSHTTERASTDRIVHSLEIRLTQGHRLASRFTAQVQAIDDEPTPH